MEECVFDGGKDMMAKLDDDTAMHVLSYLMSPLDVARASAVSAAWRRFVREGRLWRRLCTNAFPDVEKFGTVLDSSSRGRDGGSPSRSSYLHTIEMENRVFRTFCQELNGLCSPKSCVKEALVASSTDNVPDECINQTLYPRPTYNDEEHTPSYWSSIGQACPDVPETLTYQLVSRLCVVHEVRIRPFKAFFQEGDPVYSAKCVRIRLGSLPGANLDFGSENGMMISWDTSQWKDANFEWAYVSPEFPMEQVDTLQCFKLPSPVLCIGGILQVELLGRVQTQETDNKYYICVCHVMVVGRPLLDFDFEKVPSTQKYILKYFGDRSFYHPDAGTSGKNPLPGAEIAPEGSCWPSLLRQLRASRVLRRNRVLLNTLLGSFAVTSLFLPNDGSSSDEVDEDEHEEYHSLDGTALLSDDHSSEGDIPLSPMSDG